MRPSHPVRHFWPLRSQRFFCSRLRSRLSVTDWEWDAFDGHRQYEDLASRLCRTVLSGSGEKVAAFVSSATSFGIGGTRLSISFSIGIR